jgi:hypothetical protein
MLRNDSQVLAIEVKQSGRFHPFLLGKSQQWPQNVHRAPLEDSSLSNSILQESSAWKVASRWTKSCGRPLLTGGSWLCSWVVLVQNTITVNRYLSTINHLDTCYGLLIQGGVANTSLHCTS